MNKRILSLALSFLLALTPCHAAPVVGPIQIKAGIASSIGTLADRQLYFARDTGKLWIGTPTGNVLLSLSGAPGTNGVNGSNGINGTNGIQGPQGIQGAPGIAGAIGPSGATGVLSALTPLIYDSTAKSLSIGAATPISAGTISASDKTKLDGLSPVLSTSYTASMAFLTVGALAIYDVLVPGATVNMTATVNPPPGLLDSLSGLTASIEAPGYVRLRLKAGVALAAGSRVFVVKVIQ